MRIHGVIRSGAHVFARRGDIAIAAGDLLLAEVEIGRLEQLRGDSPPPPPPAPKEHGPGRPKVRQGKVISAKADKTIVVRVDVTRRHRMYKKIIRESTTLHAHDERNDENEGDLVRIIETRTMSKTKRWRLTDVLERSR